MTKSKTTLSLLFSLSLLLFLLTSCSETSEENEYSDWASRNIAYIDSIARVAELNESGDWKIFLAYGVVDSLTWGNQYHVYCQVLRRGDGTTSPSYSDTVMVNFRGRLIPTKSYPSGYIFDQSYSGTLDPLTDVPQKLNLAGCVRGWTTAMMHMVAGTTLSSGDIWRVYVPTELGYSSENKTYIPPYSTLIYDLNLVSFYPIGTPVPEY